MDKDKSTEETFLDTAEKPVRKAGASDSPSASGSDDQAWSFDEGLAGPDETADGALSGEFISGSAALDTAPGMDLSLGDAGDNDDDETGGGLEVDLSASFDGSDGADGPLTGGFDTDGDAEPAFGTGAVEGGGFDSDLPAGLDGSDGADAPLTGGFDTDGEGEPAFDTGAVEGEGFDAEPAGSGPIGVDGTAEVGEDLMGNGPEAASWSSGAEPGGVPAPEGGGTNYDEISSPSSDDEDSDGGGGGGFGGGDGGGPSGEGRRGRGRLLAALVAVAVLFAAAAVGGVPYWTGMQIEKAYRDSVEKLAGSGSVVVESIDYRRGWLSSSADTVVSTGGLTPVTFEFASHDSISHGFSVVRDLLAGNLTPTATMEGVMEGRVRMGEMTVANLPAATHSTVVDASGSGETTFEVAPFASPPGSPVQVSWKGMSGKGSFSANPGTVRGSFSFTPLKVDTPGGGFLIRNVMADVDLAEGPAGLMVGRQVASIGAVEASGEGKSLKIDTLMFSSDSTAAGTKMNYSVSERVQKIEYNGRKFGPGSIEIRLRDLDASTLAKVKNIFTKMQKMQLKGEEPGPEMTKNLVTLLAALAENAPSLEIPELTFDTGEGVVDGNIRVVVDGRGKDLAANPVMALMALDVEAGFSVPVSLVNRMSAAAADKEGGKSPARALTDLVAAGYVVKADGSYRTSLTMKGGELKVNGKDVENPLPLMMLLSPGSMPGVVDPAEPCDDRAPAMTVAGIGPGECGQAHHSTGSFDPGTARPAAGEEWKDLAAAEGAAGAEAAEPVAAAPSSPSAAKGALSAPAAGKGPVEEGKTYDVAGDIRILSSGNTRWIDRNEAARRLGEANDPRAVEPLIRALADDPDPFVRRESALSLGRLGDARAAGPLARALDDENEWVRKYAADALSDLKRGGMVHNAGL